MKDKFENLVEYVGTKLSFLGIRSENIEDAIEDGVVKSGSNKETVDGIELAKMEYTGVIFVERIQKRKIGLLLCFIIAWLKTHDDTRQTFQLSEPKWTLTKLMTRKGKAALANIEIYIEFVDPIFITPDETGAIDLHGSNYAFGQHTVDYAETANVTS